MAGSSEHPSACRVILGELLFQLQEFFHHRLAMSISNSSSAVGILTLDNHAATLQNEKGTISKPRGMGVDTKMPQKKHLKPSVMVTFTVFCNPDGYHPATPSI